MGIGKLRCCVGWLCLLGACQTRTQFEDADRDGSGKDDCAPEDPARHPGATEVFDQQDNNCDSRVDEDFDADGDGDFALPWGGDCDDSELQINSHAVEVCGDGLDNNCDGVSGLPWPAVMDVDAVASGADGAEQPDLCAAPFLQTGPAGARLGAALAGGAQTPYGPGVFVAAPGTATESAGGGAGAVGLYVAREPTGLGGEILHRAGFAGDAGASLGDALASGANVDKDADGESELLVSAYDEAVPTVYLVEGSLLHGFDLSGAVSYQMAEEGASGGSLSGALALVPDPSGDGCADLLLGATLANGEGALWVRLGDERAFLSATQGEPQVLDDVDLVLTSGAEDGLGAALAPLVDPTGLRWDGLLAGAPLAADGGEDAGAVWFVPGEAWRGDKAPAEGQEAISNLEDRIHLLGGKGDLFGTAVAGGDVDGDGTPELLVGAPGADEGATEDAGAAYLFLGETWFSGEEEIAAEDANVRLFGVYRYQAVGTSVALPGDVDGDGLGDLLIGSSSSIRDPLDDQSETDGTPGHAWLVPGREDAAWPAHIDLEAGADLTRFVGLTDGPWNVAGAGFVDGDSTAELLLGIPDASGSQGYAFLFWGQSP